MAKFLFNRIHIDSSEPIVNKVQFLLDGLVSKSATSQNNYAYKLIDVELKDNFIYGHLIKYNPYSEDEVFDEENETSSKEGINNRIVAKSFFIIDHTESLLIYEIVTNHIRKKTFAKMFKKLFIENHKGKRRAYFEISEINEQYTFLQKVQSLKTIEKVTISLVPSNPRFADRWENIDERLRENNIGRYREIQDTTSRGGIKVDKETEDKILMSEDGYGSTKVKGIDENNVPVNLTTKSKERIVSTNVPKKVVEQGFLSIINYISGTLEKIRERTDNE